MPRFAQQGVKFAAISYDSKEILKFFGDRYKIEYPMLGDPDSKVIRAYGVLNEEATGMQKGFARPGYFFIDANGVICEKFFEAKYRERLTGTVHLVGDSSGFFGPDEGARRLAARARSLPSS